MHNAYSVANYLSIYISVIQQFCLKCNVMYCRRVWETYEWWVEKESKESFRSLFQVIILHLVGVTEEETNILTLYAQTAVGALQLL